MKLKIDKKQVLKSYKSGRSMKDIARLLDCSYSHIRLMVERAGGLLFDTKCLHTEQAHKEKVERFEKEIEREYE